MRTELPVCKRCCFCIPLRHGLLTWAYIKLMSVIILTFFTMMALYDVVYISYHYSAQLGRIFFISVILIVLFVEISLTVTFIVGGHTKNVKLMRVYYNYNMVLLALSGILILIVLIMTFPLEYFFYWSWQYFSLCANFFFNLMVQIYFLLLLRSEILKLEGKFGFSFVNNAAEGECIMREDPQIEGDNIRQTEGNENSTLIMHQ